MFHCPNQDVVPIRFLAIDQWYHDHCPHPVSAKAVPPSWLRLSPIYGSEGRGSAPTIKRCAPTRDFAISGYLLRLPTSVTFRRDAADRLFITSSPRHVLSAVGRFPQEQLGLYPVPERFDSSQALKWINPWIIETPPGYSVMVQHPEGRGLDAFRTMSAIVDSDVWDCPTNIAFFIDRAFEGTIPAGTPIAHVVPFRREAWTAEIGVASKEDLLVNDQRFKTAWEQGYDRNYRQSKRYSDAPQA